MRVQSLIKMSWPQRNSLRLNVCGKVVNFTSSFPESFLPTFIVFPSKHHGSEYSCIQDKWRIDSDCCLNILNFYHFALVFVVVLSSVYSNSSLVQALTNTCMCSIQVSLWKSNQNGQSKLNGSYKHCSFNSNLNGFLCHYTVFTLIVIPWLLKDALIFYF